MSGRMTPARSSSRWLAASASAGSSRRVGMWSWDQRMPANAPWGRNVRRRPEDTGSGRRSQFDYRTRRPVAGVHPAAEQVGRQLLVAAQAHPGQAELPLLVVVVRVVERRLADQELRHVVEPELVEVVAA